MLLAAVNIGVIQTAANVFSGKSDFDGVHDIINNDIDFIHRYAIGLRNLLFGQALGNVAHILVVVKNQIKGNVQRTCIFASQDFGVVDQLLHAFTSSNVIFAVSNRESTFARWNTENS